MERFDVSFVSEAAEHQIAPELSHREQLRRCKGVMVAISPTTTASPVRHLTQLRQSVLTRRGSMEELRLHSVPRKSTVF